MMLTGGGTGKPPAVSRKCDVIPTNHKLFQQFYLIAHVASNEWVERTTFPFAIHLIKIQNLYTSFHSY